MAVQTIRVCGRWATVITDAVQWMLARVLADAGRGAVGGVGGTAQVGLAVRGEAADSGDAGHSRRSRDRTQTNNQSMSTLAHHHHRCRPWDNDTCSGRYRAGWAEWKVEQVVMEEEARGQVVEGLHAAGGDRGWQGRWGWWRLRQQWR
eukprot:595731-Prymnesium_polylepis.1